MLHNKCLDKVFLLYGLRFIRTNAMERLKRYIATRCTFIVRAVKLSRLKCSAMFATFH